MKIFILLLIAFLPSACAPVLAGIIDVHTHINSLNKPGEPETYEDLIRQMDLAGVDRSVVLSFAYAAKPNEQVPARRENEWVANLMKKDRRIIGFCGVPIGADWAADEISRCKLLGLRGLKLHPQNEQLDLRDAASFAKFRKLVEHATALELPVLVDSAWTDTAITLKIFRMAIENPKLRLICAHAFFTNFRDLFALAGLYEAYPEIPRNIFVDISATLYLYRDHPERDLLKWHLEKFGLDRVLFGSDYPIATPLATLEALDRYGFTPAQKAQIFSESAVRGLGF